MYLEWAPVGLLPALKPKAVGVSDSLYEEQEVETATVFVKNLNFATTEDSLKSHFSATCPVKSVKIPTKKNLKNPGQPLSMGFGFVEFNSKEDAKKAMVELNQSTLDNHVLLLKASSQSSTVKETSAGTEIKAISTKLIVRNVPFEATEREVRELFKAFGKLKRVRLPRKADGSHRGFGFVEFLTKQEAKNAFESLSNTHLYGRHLVMEWARDDDTSLEAVREKSKRDLMFNSKKSAKKVKIDDTIEDLSEEEDE